VATGQCRRKAKDSEEKFSGSSPLQMPPVKRRDIPRNLVWGHKMLVHIGDSEIIAKLQALYVTYTTQPLNVKTPIEKLHPALQMTGSAQRPGNPHQSATG